MRPPRNAVLQVLLRAAALAFGGAASLRNRHYDSPRNVERVPLPVLSVGNLTVGGTGKTPIVAWLAETLRVRGRRPAIVSRGYRGSAGRGPLVVSIGAGPLCSSAECGDEPFLLARSLHGVAVVVGSDRVAGARAASELGADVVILDDGFQHRRLARDLDLVLLDASNPFGNYALLPAGLLREPVRSLGRASVVMITRSRPDERFAVIERVVRHHNPRAPIVRAGHEVSGFVDRQGRTAPTPARAFAFCAIGNPARFRIDLERTGIELVGFEALRDHHRFTACELASYAARAREAGARLVTTEKDAARIGDLPPGLEVDPLLLRIEAVVYDRELLIAEINRALEGKHA